MNTALRVYILHRNVCVKCDRILGTKQTQNCGNVQTFVSEYINVNTRGQFMTLILCKCSTFETLTGLVSLTVAMCFRENFAYIFFGWK